MHEEEILAYLNNIARDVNLIKNGVTVKIDENTALTRLFTGQKMFVDVRDISIAPHIMLDGEWERSTTDTLVRILSPDSVFIDIGANFGYFTLIAGTVITNGTIFALEPNPDITPTLNKSLNINGLRNRAFCHQIAISDTVSEVTLHVAKDLWGASSISESFIEKRGDISITKTEKIKAITLDQFCLDQNLDKVDVIKVDVEGGEQKVWNGMQNIIKKNPQLKILLEFTFDVYEDEESFFELLQKAFKKIYCVEGNSDLTLLSSYDELKSAKTDLVMLLLSNSWE